MDNQEILKAYAMSFLGLPYEWGGDDPINGFDCSGMVLELLKSQGLWGKTDASSQSLFLYFVNQGPSALASIASFGTILFYGKDVKNITHTAFALSPTLMLEAGSGDSTVTSKEVAADKNAFIRVRPILARGDLVGMFNPKYSWRQK